jgi:hydroxymethylpyrimidine pyrophosphatase-like HAD family hydrolase
MKSNFKENVLYDIAYDLGIQYIKLLNKNIFNPTVMFDIDDTLLYVNKNNTLTPIKQMIKLLNYCKRNGFIILIITARDSRYYKETLEDLKTNKIYYDYLYLRESPKDDYHLFKSDIKKKFMDTYNLTVVMSIGDNDIDIAGKYSGYSIKLPNKSNPLLYHNYNGKFENVVP